MPRQNNCSVGEENSWTESGSGNFGVDSVDSDKKSFFDSKRSNSFNFSAASSHSTERHQDLQRGIALLKTSVSAITAHYYNSLGLDVPSNLSTFDAFAKMLHMLSSSKALRAALESNIASRYNYISQACTGSQQCTYVFQNLLKLASCIFYLSHNCRKCTPKDYVVIFASNKSLL